MRSKNDHTTPEGATTGSPHEALLRRLEDALDRLATNAERDLMLWLCPPAAELRRLPAARGLLATSWDQVDRASGAEAGFLFFEEEGAVAVSVDSRVHLHLAGHVDLRDGVAATLAKLVAVGVRPLALHTVIHCSLPQSDAARAGLQAAVEGLSTYARQAGVATLGAELCFDAEYRDALLVDSVAIGWCDRAAFSVEAHTPAHGDRLIAVAGEQLDRVRAELVEAQFPFLALPTSSDVPLRAVIAAIGEHGLRLTPHTADPAHPDQALDRFRPDPTRSILLVLPADVVERAGHVAARHKALVAELGTITTAPMIAVGPEGSAATVLPCAAVREKLEIPSTWTEPEDSGPGRELTLEELPEPEDYDDTLRRMLRSPNLASRGALYERFDSFAGAATILHPGPGGGTTAIRTPMAGRGVAVATTGNPRFAALDPYVGFCIAVCEGVRRLGACGATPRAVVGGTSFGASHDPEVVHRAEQGLSGLRDAALAFALPCLALTTSPAGPDDHGATPVTPGLSFLGTLDGVPLTPWFKDEGDVVLLLGRSREEVAGSEYAAWIHGALDGNPPWVDFEAERSLSRVLSSSIEAGLLKSARIVGSGGLALAVVGACCATPAGVPARGARIVIDEGMRPDAWLFAESQARAIVSVPREHVAAVRDRADDAELPFAQIGEVSSGVLEFGELIGLTLDELLDIWNGALAERLGKI